MPTDNLYPQLAMTIKELLMASIRCHINFTKYCWRMIIMFFLCHLGSALIPPGLPDWLRLPISILFVLAEFSLIMLLLSRGHQYLLGTNNRYFLEKKQWVSLIFTIAVLILCTFIIAISLKHVNVSQYVNLVINFSLSSLLVFFYLASIFVYPLVIIDKLKLSKALPFSLCFFRESLAKVIVLYFIFITMVLLALPGSSHMLILSQYFLNIPATFAIIVVILPIIIIYWLLLTNDCKQRLLNTTPD